MEFTERLAFEWVFHWHGLSQMPTNSLSSFVLSKKFCRKNRIDRIVKPEHYIEKAQPIYMEAKLHFLAKQEAEINSYTEYEIEMYFDSVRILMCVKGFSAWTKM